MTNNKRWIKKLIALTATVAMLFSWAAVGFAAPGDAADTPAESAQPIQSEAAQPTESTPPVEGTKAPESAPPEGMVPVQSAQPIVEETQVPEETGTESPVPTESTPPSGGEFQITTLEEMNRIGTNDYPADATYILQNDIDGQGAPLRPIGTEETPFTGTFDGNGFTVSNINITSRNNAAFFGALKGTVKNLAVADVKVTLEADDDGKAAGRAGIFAALIDGGKVENIFAAGSILISGQTEAEESSEVPEIPVYAGAFAGEITASGETMITGATAAGDIKTADNIDFSSGGAAAFVGKNDAKADKFMGCIWSSVYGQKSALGAASNETDIPDVGTVAGEPAYLELRLENGESVQMAAGEGKNGLAFHEWVYDENYLILADSKTPQAEITAMGMEASTEIWARYEYNPQNSEKSSYIDFGIPVIIAGQIEQEDKLEPVDGIFPEQIGGVQQLTPIDGVFDEAIKVGEGMIVSNPTNQTGGIGEEVTFRVQTTGNVTYQWQYSTDGQNWTDIEGADEAVYTFVAQAQDDGKQFRCVVVQQG